MMQLKVLLEAILPIAFYGKVQLNIWREMVLVPRINILCLAGVSLGLMAFLLPAIQWQFFPWYHLWVNPSPTLLDLLYSGQLHLLVTNISTISILIAVLILGLLLSILTPIGGFVELVGISGLILTSNSFEINLGYRHIFFGSAGDGLWLALISSVIIISSFFLPLGIGLKPLKFNIPIKVLTTFSLLDGLKRIDIRKHSLNILCIAGASIAIIGLLLPWGWGYETESRYYSAHNILQYLSISGIAINLLSFSLIMSLILSFLTPIAGAFLLSTSISIFLIQNRIGTVHETLDFECGFIITFCASVIVLASYFVQLKHDGIIWKYNLKNRIWNIRKLEINQEKKGKPEEKKSIRPHFHFNLFEILACLIALASLSQIWLIDTGIEISFAVLLNGSVMSSMTIALAFFIVGSIANFLTSIGNIIQTSSYAIFFASWLSISSFGISLGLGALLALCSCAIGIIGLLHPIYFPRYRKKRLSRNLLSIILDY